MKISPEYKIHQDSIAYWIISQLEPPKKDNTVWWYDITYGTENDMESPDIATIIDGKSTAFIFAERDKNNLLCSQIEIFS